MQAAVFQNGELKHVTDYRVPAPALGEALVRVTLAGICGTDLEILEGYAGYEGILGHEFVGVVETAGDQSEWVGKRVTGSINLGCGTCAVCMADGPEHCAERTVLGIIGKDGVFAEYVTLPLANLHAVPIDVSDEAAVFTEPLAAALRIGEQIALRPGERAAVIGPGRLGLLIGQVLAHEGLTVTVLGRQDSSLGLAKVLGLETGIASQAAAASFDLVVEATGNDEGLAQALRLVRAQGTLVMKSTYQGNAHVDLTPLVVKELKVVGSRCGPFAPALQMLAQGTVAVAPLIEATYPLVETEAALAHAARPGVRKILLRP